MEKCVGVVLCGFAFALVAPVPVVHSNETKEAFRKSTYDECLGNTSGAPVIKDIDGSTYRDPVRETYCACYADAFTKLYETQGFERWSRLNVEFGAQSNLFCTEPDTSKSVYPKIYRFLTR